MFGSVGIWTGHGARRAFRVLCGCAALGCPAAARGALLINEVLYDPPGSDTGREFVEIVNAGGDAVDLGAARLESGDGSKPGVWRLEWSGAAGVVLAPGAFFCVGEEAVSPAPDAVVNLDLQNGPDACRLICDGIVCDLVGWGEHADAGYYRGNPAADVSGMSLARVPDGADTGDNNRDFSPLATPTPGSRNAYTYDAAIAEHSIEREPALPAAAGRFRWRVPVTNAGTGTCVGAMLSLEEGPAPRTISVPALERGETATVEFEDAAPEAGVLTRVFRLSWGEDLYAANDAAVVRFRAGTGPLVVSEIAYAPAAGASEWVEIANRSAEPVDASGWSFCDSHDEPVFVPAGTAPLAPGGLLVLSQMPMAGIPAVVPEGRWPALNNTRQSEAAFADRLRLADPEGLLSDEVAYLPDWGGGDGASLERVSPALHSAEPSAWGTCVDPSGGTPGRANSIALASSQSSGALVAEPSPFSPDGDGRDDRALITVAVPQGTISAEARIYDLAGREVRSLGRLDPGRCRVLWDGRDGSSHAVPLGLYVIVATGRGGGGSSWRLTTSVVVASPLRRGS